jgi:hypothetical protein
MTGSVITAGTTRTQAGATAITEVITTINTSTAPSAGALLGDGVVLPSVGSGTDTIFLLNNTANPVQLYGNGTDTVNGVAGATGVVIPPNDVAVVVEALPGAWQFEAGYGSSGQYQTMLALTAISAAGTTQATGTPLVAMLNNVTTVASGTGVNLPASAAGLEITVMNNGVNPMLVYPAQGASDTINGIAATQGVIILPGTVASFNCAVAGAWTVQPASTKAAAFNTNSAVTSATLTAANISGGVASVDLQLTGTLTGASNATLPTVANLIAALHAPTVGTSYRLRITNASSGAYTWTVLTATGWTLTGTMTVAQNTWREFVLTLTSLTAATLQSVAVGTYS